MTTRSGKLLDRSLTRRALLRVSLDLSLAATAATAAAYSHRARGQAPDALESTVLRPGLTRLSGEGGNIVLLRTAAGGVLVDSGTAAQGDVLFETVAAALEGRRVEALFNTHWHLDHTGGNDVFGKGGTRIVAHENTRLWMSTDYYVDWQDRRYHPRAPEALPTDTFYTHEPQPIRTEIGGVAIEYAYLREAHTDGDIYVFFPDSNVLVAGGAVSAGAYPVLDFATGGWIGGLEDATRKLLEIADAETLIVPQSGPAQRRSHLEAQLEMVTTVRERVADLMREGRSAEEMLEAGVTDEFDAHWGDNRRRFVSNVYGGLWWQGRLDGSL